MSKAKKMLTNWKIMLLIIALMLSLWLIHPVFSEGVAIRYISKDSAAAEAGMLSPAPSTKPTNREVIKAIDGVSIKTLEDYKTALSAIDVNQTFLIKTNKNTYFITTRENIVTEYDEETNETISKSIGLEDIGISVYSRPSNNIRKGLDLEGGTRVLLEPEEEATPEDMALVVSSIEQRLNVYGVSDVTVRITSNLFGKSYIAVEIPGANEQEVKALLAQQGKFEARIGDKTVFRGGDKDIVVVYRTAERAGIEPGSCAELSTAESTCRFRFGIALSKEAAQRQADATRDLQIISTGLGSQNSYLSKNLSLYLDDELVDELMISAELRGNAVTEISISGSGIGTNEKAAKEDALNNMKSLQTILITGSLPVKMKIAKTDTLSPVLGSNFIKSAVMAGLLAIFLVSSIIAIRYRKIKIILPIIFIIFSEVILILGFASLIGWRLDIAAIAAIIITVGSGINAQIIITDEILHKEKITQITESWKQRLSRAFTMVFASFFTLTVAMIPLFFAGAGLLKGFAFTTIAGIALGVLIARPAFGEIIEILVENE